MTHLTAHALEELIEDARLVDRGRPRPAILPRIRQLIEENRELREQAGERERMHAQEVGW